MYEDTEGGDHQQEGAEVKDLKEKASPARDAGRSPLLDLISKANNAQDQSRSAKSHV